MSYKEEGKRVLESAPIAVGEGEVNYSGRKAKRSGFFVGVFRDR